MVVDDTVIEEIVFEETLEHLHAFIPVNSLPVIPENMNSGLKLGNRELSNTSLLPVLDLALVKVSVLIVDPRQIGLVRGQPGAELEFRRLVEVEKPALRLPVLELSFEKHVLKVKLFAVRRAPQKFQDLQVRLPEQIVVRLVTDESQDEIGMVEDLRLLG